MDEINTKAEEAYRLAYEYEQYKEHCAQCTMAAIMEALDMVDETLFKACDGMTGGVALSTEGTCGALSAGILSISRLTGRTYENFVTKQPGHTWQYVKALFDRFMKEYGSPNGKDVQKKIFGEYYNFTIPEEKEKFVKAGAYIDKCPSVCGNVAKWTVEIILKIQKELSDS